MSERPPLGSLVVALVASLPTLLFWGPIALDGGDVAWMVLPILFAGTAGFGFVQALATAWVLMHTDREQAWGWLAGAWFLMTALAALIGPLRMWTTG